MSDESVKTYSSFDMNNIYVFIHVSTIHTKTFKFCDFDFKRTNPKRDIQETNSRHTAFKWAQEWISSILGHAASKLTGS